jgi:hypothetical protein
LEHEYHAKFRQLSVNKLELVATNNPFPTKASGSGQSSFVPYDLSSDDDEYLTPNNITEMTPGLSDWSACILTGTRLYLKSPPDAPMNWRQINPNRNDYHYDLIIIPSTFWLPDITDSWHQQEETHSKFADLSNVACRIFSIMSHGVEVEASFSLAQDVIEWRQSNTASETLHEKVIVRLYARANNGILKGDDPVLYTAEAETT